MTIETNMSSFNSPTRPCPRPPPEPPLLSPFLIHRVDACDGCRDAIVATRGARTFYATEAGLDIEELGEPTRAIPLPMPALPGSWNVSSPSIAVENDSVLVGALATSGPVRALEIASWSHAGSWDATRTILAPQLPPLAIAERAWVTMARGAIVAVIAANGSAWAARSTDGGDTFGAPESLTPAGGTATYGAPVVDPHGRIAVPFAFTPIDITNALPLAPAAGMPTLEYASLAPEGSWTIRPGPLIAGGLAPGTRPVLSLADDGISMTWVDAKGVARRSSTTDEGTSWSDAARLSAPGAVVVGTPAMIRDGSRSTEVWWEEGSRLVATRWNGSRTMSEVVARSNGTEDPTLTIAMDGGAVAAWIDHGQLMAGIEAATARPTYVL